VTKDQAAELAFQLMADGMHCSEAVVQAAGQYFWGTCPEVLARAASPLGGGVAGTRDEICGALSGAILIIGAKYGRVSVDQSQDKAYASLSKQLREQFLAYASTTRCSDVKLSVGQTEDGCKIVAQETVRMLLELID